MYTLFTYTYKIVIGILNTKWTISVPLKWDELNN